MFETPNFWWLNAILAIVLGADALLSVRPPSLIRGCLTGVRFPEEWWWTLIVIKLAATAGLIVGIYADGVGATVTVGVIVYFLCAVYAHIRARFLRSEFWINCLGMLALALTVLIAGYLAPVS